MNRTLAAGTVEAGATPRGRIGIRLLAAALAVLAVVLGAEGGSLPWAVLVALLGGVVAFLNRRDQGALPLAPVITTTLFSKLTGTPSRYARRIRPWSGPAGSLDPPALRARIRPWGPAGSLDYPRAARAGIRPWGGPAGSWRCWNNAPMRRVHAAVTGDPLGARG